MKGLFNIYAEGIADVVFFKQYIYHLWGVEVPENSIVKLDGWTNLKGVAWQQRMKTMTDNGGTNTVIIDADKDIDARRSDILKWKKDNDLEFELFLLPNDKDAGALEDLLENIINPNNKPIFECWEGYEKELVKLDISRQNAPALDHASQENQDLRLSRSLVGRIEEPKRVDQRTQPRLRKRPALDFGCGVFGGVEEVFGKLFN